MHKKHKNSQLREHLYDATRAITEHEYDVAIQRRENSKFNHDVSWNSGFNHGQIWNSKNNHHSFQTRYASSQVSEFTLQMDSSPPPSPPSSHQSCALHIGCEFDTVESLKQLCHDLAIEDRFEFKPRSSKTAYTIVCKGEGCAWRLYASSIDSSRRFHIKTFNSKHSCFGINHGEINKQLQH